MAVVALRVVIFAGLLIICEGQRHGGFEDQYIGCFLDKDDRALESIAYKDRTQTNSNGRCIRECSSRGFMFAGTQVGHECHCGNNNDYKKHGSKPKDCTLGCQGNTAETCGGNWRLQIYSVCPIGKYKGAGEAVIDGKPNCESECHCKALPCLYLNGICTDGCAIGWKEDACNERGITIF
ncbi:hypothetical protein CAPTEDRAFT_210655 [Capitella teleta]|uniref:WSC domain-containing protein n=1 Tax=Capitella teleta TaxID=283909 RepID=R7VH13_CAPTE|nr:hypothetical protein CAPTEDRAFT_210655 [Capitella teleta]|eukprot:ELU15591.1 hypothetical protein CAPTEDRAFT_210655 [Capitella teleta]